MALKSKYIDLSFLCPTSTVIVESLFSRCSRVMTANRKHMLPCLFEAIVCLRENREWWDINLVQDMVAGLWKTALDCDYGEVEAFEASDEDDDDAGSPEW
jgi:hypothetical protein